MCGTGFRGAPSDADLPAKDDVMDLEDLFGNDKHRYGKGHGDKHGSRKHRGDHDEHGHRAKHDDEWGGDPDRHDDDHGGRGRIDDEHSDGRHSRPSFPGLGHAILLPKLKKLFQNKVLAAGCLLVALVLVGLLLWLVVALIGAINQHGLKGAVDLVNRTLKWLWEGSGKG
jgi:hypothetical protein